MRGNPPILLPWILLLSAALSACHSERIAPPDPVQRARERLARSPRDPSVYLELATLAMERQDNLRAMQYLSLAERADLPAEQAEALFRMAITIAVRTRNYSDAVRRTEERLRVQESLELRRLLALLTEAHGEQRDAERQHLIILELYPGAVAALTEAARFYERSGLPDRWPRARELYLRYLKVAPDGPESAQVRAALVVNQHLAQQSQ